ncbi:MAG: ATP-binding protein [Candidatus Aenigmarchaeota archaeon]|nr:ATP-binding protein [Candidatus Aenigmarchaeota archaeon]
MNELEKLRETITVVGRNKEDLNNLGTKASGFIGKHIVGTDEDAHLTTAVHIDLFKPHVILCSGKRGSGKSYSIAVILEELLQLEKFYLDRTAAVVFDPVGIYWSMKFPNEQQRELTIKWNLEPRGFEGVKIYVPAELQEAYENAGIPVDYAIAISAKEFSPEDWILAFNFEPTSEFAINLQRKVNALLEEKFDFTIDDLITRIKDDEQISQHVKNVLVNYFEVAKGWGIFAEKGMKIADIVKAGEVSVVDLSRVKGEEWGIRNLLAAWITRQVYRERVIARKEEELAKLEGRQPKTTFPLTWLVFEEAHNFIPSDRQTVSSESIKMIAKQGREPGVGLVVISQMPNRIHQEIISQTDIVISFRLTSRDDLQALHSVMQTYVREKLEKVIGDLPRIAGSATILDDNLEKIFTVNIRPRLSHHSGSTATIV